MKLGCGWAEGRGIACVSVLMNVPIEEQVWKQGVNVNLRNIQSHDVEFGFYHWSCPKGHRNGI